MYITYITSDEYAPYAGISLTSLFESNKDMKHLKIFLLVYDISNINKEKFLLLGKKFDREIEFIYVNEMISYLQSEYNISKFNGSCVGYTRMYPHKIFPDYVERILYLDADTIIVGNLEELDKMDMNGYAMSMCENLVFELDPDGLAENERLALERTGKSYNNGVILFNIPEYRHLNIEKCIDQEMRKGEKYIFAEQSILNCALPQGCVKILPMIYNSSLNIYSKREIKDVIRILGEIYADEKDLISAENSPIVVHYLGTTSRPWFTESTSRKKNLYLKYKEASPWKDEKQKSFYKTNYFVNLSKKDQIVQKILINLWDSTILYWYKKINNKFTKW